MLALSDSKEQLSLAHVLSLASSEQLSMEITRVDRDSIDAQIRARGLLSGNAQFASPYIDLQIKSSSSVKISGGRLKLQLKKKNYDDLRIDNPMVPRLLVVYVMPSQRSQWTSHSSTAFTSRHCAYWLNLKGMPASLNRAKVTVDIPTSNVLSPTELRRLLTRAGRMEDLG